MYFYDFYSYIGRFKEKTGKILLFTRSKISPLLLFSFRPRVKSASRDQLVKQEFTSQSNRSPWPFDSSYYRQLQAIVTVTAPKHSKNGGTFCSIAGLFPLIFHSCYSRNSQLFFTRLVNKEQAGKTKAN